MVLGSGSLHVLRKFEHRLCSSSSLLVERAMSTCIDPSNNESRGLEFRGSVMERIQQQQQLEAALDRLERSELLPEATLYAYLLQRCTSLGALSTGLRIHEHIARNGMEGNGLLGNLLLQMYVKSGSIERARKLRVNKSDWGVLLWTKAIAAYAQKGYMYEAVRLFQEMLLEAFVKPDGVVFVTVLGACKSAESLGFGRKIDGCICEEEQEVSFSNVVLTTALINMYARCGGVEDARRVFESATHARNVVMYTTMIAAYAEMEHRKRDAVHLFRQMQQEGVLPDKICFVATLNACTGGAPADLELGKFIHSCVTDSGLDSNTVVATALVNMYGKAGALHEASTMFRTLQRKDVVSWTALVSAYAKNNLHQEALQLFRQMNLEGIQLNEVGYISLLDAFGCPEAVAGGQRVHQCISETGYLSSINIANAVIRMYGRCSSMDDAWNVFRSMGMKDVISWTNICTTLVQHDRCNIVIHLYRQMQLDGIKPDGHYFAFLLQACAALSAAAEGRLAHQRIVESGLETDDVLRLAIMNMYGKCGNLRAAHKVFDSMGERDAVAWTTLLSSHAHYGHSGESLLLFWRMQQDGAKPDSISILCVLSVCSHAGLVDRGWDYFLDITREFGLEAREKHFGCMIDLLGRSGDLEAAEIMMTRMPFQPTAMNWTIFLAACKVHRDTERGKRAAEKVLELEPVPAVYVSLSNIYAAAGEWDQVERVRDAMKAMGLQKDPGRSSIEVNNRVYEFFAGDKTHARTDEIYAVLEKLTRQLEDAGYVPDTKLVLLNVSEEQKERLLCHHSEKLAIAFGLLNLPSGHPLRIVKNLRVCGDCHTAAKFISKIAGREIFMRDTQRFHHFSDGKCSCADYW